MGEQEPGSEPITWPLSQQIAAREGVDPVDLPTPLGAVIDIDSLETLIYESNCSMLKVEFVYVDHQITIERGNEIRIEVE